RELGQGIAIRDAEVLGIEDAVGVAEGGPRQGVRREAQVSRPEPWGAAVGGAEAVEGAVLRAQARFDRIVGGAEDPALPAPPVPAGMRGQATVARPGLELRPVETVPGHGPQDG